MKKLTSVFILSIIFYANYSQAQSPLKTGIRGGINFSSLGNSDFETEPRTGIMAGVVIDLALPLLPFDLESGVYYTQKGVKFDQERTELKFKLDYIEVPLLAKIYFSDNPTLKPYFLAGPYIEFNINATSESTENENRVNIDLSDETEFVNFGLIGGVGTDINIGVTQLNVQGRFGLGLRNTFNDRFGDDENNMVFSLVTGFTF